MKAGICAVVPAHNEEGFVGRVLHQLLRAGVSHCVLVANGCSDNTLEEAKPVLKKFQGATIAALAEPLGLDVGRAVGALTALRSRPEPDWLVFVDADWQGGFGPHLADFLMTGVEGKNRILFVGQSGVRRLDQRLWEAALFEARSDLCGLQPNLLPLMVHRSIFRVLSPRWLAHPGQFAGLCLRRLPASDVGVYADWDPRLVGNRQRGWGHDRAMRDLLLGDAIEGIGLLAGEQKSRVWRGQPLDGGHSKRRFDLLDRWASTAMVGSPSAFQEIALPYDLV